MLDMLWQSTVVENGDDLKVTNEPKSAAADDLKIKVDVDDGIFPEDEFIERAVGRM